MAIERTLGVLRRMVTAMNRTLEALVVGIIIGSAMMAPVAIYAHQRALDPVVQPKTNYEHALGVVSMALNWCWQSYQHSNPEISVEKYITCTISTLTEGVKVIEPEKENP